MDLDKLLVELNYSSDIELIIREKFVKDEKKIKEIANTAYEGENYNFSLCWHRPLMRLLVVTYLLLQKYDEYKSKGVSDKIIFDTFRDVSLRAGLYYRKTGKIGINKEDVIWFRHIININIFKIGVLQFQPFEMIYLDEETIGEAYMTFSSEQKEFLPPGSPVINCHIQYGANLNNEAVDKSLEDAKVFFRTCFPKVHYKAFLCYSWLLYPPMIGCLSETSKIRQFAGKFTVIGLCNDSEQALENLFEDGKGKKLPNPSILQKLAVEKPQILGLACGIIEMEEIQK